MNQLTVDAGNSSSCHHQPLLLQGKYDRNRNASVLNLGLERAYHDQESCDLLNSSKYRDSYLKYGATAHLHIFSNSTFTKRSTVRRFISYTVQK